MLNVLELFAGSRSIGKTAESLGMKVFSVDWDNYDGIDLVVDIGTMTKDAVPFVPDIIWASPDCTTYSIAAISTHRDGIKPKSEYAKKCDEVNRHFIKLINEWFIINPKIKIFIENPVGMLRKMPFMQYFERATVTYCSYGDSRMKPTDIFSNHIFSIYKQDGWLPRPMCRNYKYNEQGDIINRHCHHESARRGAKTGTQGRDGSYDRSKIPYQLCKEILLSVVQNPERSVATMPNSSNEDDKQIKQNPFGG